MKSPTLSHTVDTLDFNLLSRNANGNFQPVETRKFRRRTSRKNLAIFTLIYAACLLGLLMLAL
jgi:hypothetical protein